MNMLASLDNFLSTKTLGVYVFQRYWQLWAPSSPRLPG